MQHCDSYLKYTPEPVDPSISESGVVCVRDVFLLLQDDVKALGQGDPLAK